MRQGHENNCGLKRFGTSDNLSHSIGCSYNKISREKVKTRAEDKRTAALSNDSYLHLTVCSCESCIKKDGR